MTDERTQLPNIQVNNTPTADHDLLIRLDTKFDILAGKFDDLSENIVSRVDELEKDMVKTRTEQKDIKTDLDENMSDVKSLTRYMWMAVGAITLLQVYLLYRQAFPGH
jgi:hypothetical protein